MITANALLLPGLINRSPINIYRMGTAGIILKIIGALTIGAASFGF